MKAMLLGIAAVALAALPLSSQGYKDPSTGVDFPASLMRAGATHTLTGTGVRTRTFLKVKVYAYGLYVDAAGAKTALAGWSGKSAGDLQRDNSFYAKLLERPFGMTLRLVMTRDVDGTTMAEAFDGALRPRVQAAASRGMLGGEAALDQFRGFFSDKVANGTELVFTCTPEGALSSSISGEAKADIASAPLCWALFDVYLGREPISSDGKKTVIAMFPTMLQ